MTRKKPADGPELERTITLVDAVVSIAMTLLVLPLVDVAGELERLDLPAFWAANRNLLITFAISFVVIYAFWQAHGGLFRRMREGGREDVRYLTSLNFGWLLMIAFLPFPTAAIGGHVTTTTAPVYLISLFVLSCLSLGMTVVVHRAVGLPLGLAWITTAVFAVAAAISFVRPNAGMYVLFVLVLVRPIENRRFDRAVASIADDGDA